MLAAAAIEAPGPGMSSVKGSLKTKWTNTVPRRLAVIGDAIRSSEGPKPPWLLSPMRLLHFRPPGDCSAQRIPVEAASTHPPQRPASWTQQRLLPVYLYPTHM